MIRFVRLWPVAFALLVASLASAQLTANVTLTQASSALLPLRRVQTELKLTAAQKTALEATFKGYGQRIMQIQKTAKTMPEATKLVNQAKLATANKAIGLLTSPQRVRLRQIGMQAYGVFSAAAADVAKELGLSGAQIASLKRIQAASGKEALAITTELRKAASAVPRPKDQKDKKAVQAYVAKVQGIIAKRTPSDRKRLAAIKAKGEAKALAVFTKAQRQKWVVLQGKKFTAK